MLQDQELSLFLDWIYPATLESFRNKDILECGCGGGQHTLFMRPQAKTLVAVDLNTTDVARDRNRSATNVEFIEADIASMDLGRRFDVVLSVGVVHHTDEPDRTVANLIRHVKPGGRLILWVYSQEGNILVRYLVEPIRKMFLTKMTRKLLYKFSRAITAALYIPVYTIYFIPFRFLPYYDYFKNFRQLSFERNVLNVFDKLNAPQVQFISRERFEKWFDPNQFSDIHISHYCGVSWRGSATLKA